MWWTFVSWEPRKWMHRRITCISEFHQGDETQHGNLHQNATFMLLRALTGRRYLKYAAICSSARCQTLFRSNSRHGKMLTDGNRVLNYISIAMNNRHDNDIPLQKLRQRREDMPEACSHPITSTYNPHILHKVRSPIGMRSVQQSNICDIKIVMKWYRLNTN